MSETLASWDKRTSPVWYRSQPLVCWLVFLNILSKECFPKGSILRLKALSITYQSFCCYDT